MVAMSRAIRHVIEDYATLPNRPELPPLKRVPTGDLEEIATILEAFYLDTKEELDRRRGNGE